MSTDTVKMTPAMAQVVRAARKIGLDVEEAGYGTFGYHIVWNGFLVLSVYADRAPHWPGRRRQTRIRHNSATVNLRAALVVVNLYAGK